MKSPRTHLTRQMKQIIAILEESDTALSAAEIYEKAVLQKYPMAISTAYRVLPSMTKHGKLHRTVDADGVARYGIHKSSAAVFTDAERGTSLHIGAPGLEEFVQRIALKEGIALGWFRLELFGQRSK